MREARCATCVWWSLARHSLRTSGLPARHGLSARSPALPALQARRGRRVQRALLAQQGRREQQVPLERWGRPVRRGLRVPQELEQPARSVLRDQRVRPEQQVLRDQPVRPEQQVPRVLRDFKALLAPLALPVRPVR